jgi:CRP/FNR family transcriptional regulator, cyclic AMP receptor protein
MRGLSHVHLMEILSRISLFHELPGKELELILNMHNTFEVIRKDTYFIHEGKLEPYFYILLSGHAAVLYRDHFLFSLGPGDFIGEVGFICNKPRIASVIAEDDLVVMKIDSHKFAQLPFKVRDPIKDKIIAGLVLRLSQLNDTLVELREALPPPSGTKLRDVEERLASKILK